MKKFSSLILFLSLVGYSFSSKLTEIQYRNEFTSWMSRNQRSYASEEFITRYSTFKSNLDFINQWNSKGSETILGLNKFADITNDQYRENYLSEPFDSLSSPLIHIKKEGEEVSKNNGVDWRKQGAVSSVKNQIGGCGSWPLSAIGATESAHFLANQKDHLVSLSEQNLIDCSNLNKPCYQGKVNEAFQYIIDAGGIDTEESYPFNGGERGKCNYNSSNSGASLSSYKKVISGSESSLESAVSLKPVATYIDASCLSFQFYSSGIYYEASCSSTDLNLSVLVVGYDSSSSSSDSKYWIVQNSWGTSWGEDGYILMSKDRGNNCGISTMAFYPIV
ncbi:hypothetical protein RB653_010419 [Dictyostelium firmibasis]|uniref:Uncharacterized protein n=1 Tax=Dictyostelium firmibasis TaxID=79012 RepID=A0AAN7U1F2_9MYCE